MYLYLIVEKVMGESMMGAHLAVGEDELSEFLNAMGILADTVLNGSNVQAMQEREKKEEEEFLKRDQEIIRNEMLPSANIASSILIWRRNIISREK